MHILPSPSYSEHSLLFRILLGRKQRLRKLRRPCDVGIQIDMSHRDLSLAKWGFGNLISRFERV